MCIEELNGFVFALYMWSRGVRADTQLVRDLLVGHPGCDQLDDVDLTRRERARPPVMLLQQMSRYSTTRPCSTRIPMLFESAPL